MSTQLFGAGVLWGIGVVYPGALVLRMSWECYCSSVIDAVPTCAMSVLNTSSENLVYPRHFFQRLGRNKSRKKRVQNITYLFTY